MNASSLERRVKIGCGVLLLAVIVISAIVTVVQYCNRPMFGNEFSFAKFIPRWEIGCQFTGDKILWTDMRLNTVALVRTGDSNYRGRIVPQESGNGVTFMMPTGAILRLPRVSNTVFLCLSDGEIKTCVAPPHYAETIGRIPLTANTDFANVFRQVAAATVDTEPTTKKAK